MAKYIKRTGVIFISLVISCLLLIGIILTLNATSNNQDSSDLGNDGIQTVVSKVYSLTGDYLENQDTWNEAINYSVSNNRASVVIALLADWQQQYSSTIYASAFGFGDGFTEKGGLYIPPQAYITLDLSGYSLIGGYNTTDFIVVEGFLEIRNLGDSYNYKDEVLSGNISGAAIKNARMTSGNPLIKVSGSSAEFHLSGGYITQNTISVSSSNTNYGILSAENGAEIHLERGAFCNNSFEGDINISTQHLVAVLVKNKGKCYMGGGSYKEIVIVEKNQNVGGVYVESGGRTYVKRGEGYVYGSYRYDINLNGSTLYIMDSDVSGTYGIVATLGQTFTANYKHYKKTTNPVGMFIFNKFYTGNDHCAVIDDSSGEVKFIPKSEMKLVAKPTLGSSDNYIVEYESDYYPVGFDSNAMTISENVTNYIGVHYANVTPKSGYLWADNYGYETLSFRWQRVKKNLIKPTLETGTFEYDGTSKSPIFNDYDTSRLRISGTDSAIDAGEYGVSISLKSNSYYAWKDNTTSSLNFKWYITEKPIEQPATTNNVLVFNNSSIVYEPEGFVSSQMEITGNVQTNVGKYTATVSLKPNYKWADGTKTALEYDYEIIHPGVKVEDNINWDYLYLDNNFRKTYANSFTHRLNDNDIATIDGNIRYVMGGISTNTKLSVFLNNLRNDLNLIKVYDKNSHIIYDGIASNGVIPESVANILVGTGFKVELYENETSSTAFDTVYLSVLGDINGDGRITASDIAYLREIAKDNSILNSIDIEYRLAAMINNKGGVTNIDSEILYNVMAREIELNLFFKSGVNTDSNYKYLTLNKENGKYERVVSETATNVIGNVAVNTKVSEFKANLAILGVNTAGITIYKNEQELDDNAIVGTGCYFEIAGVKTYISVLGDLNGDGRISASDIMYLNRIKAEDYTAVEDYIILSALILNTGNITSADTAVLEVVLEYASNISNY